MSGFRPSIIVASDNTVLSLHYVESFKASEHNEDATVAKLNDDVVAYVVMLSGREYKISMKQQINTFERQGVPDNVQDTYTAILEKWTRLLIG